MLSSTQVRASSPYVYMHATGSSSRVRTQSPPVNPLPAPVMRPQRQSAHATVCPPRPSGGRLSRVSGGGAQPPLPTTHLQQGNVTRGHYHHTAGKVSSEESTRASESDDDSRCEDKEKARIREPMIREPMAREPVAVMRPTLSSAGAAARERSVHRYEVEEPPCHPGVQLEWAAAEGYPSVAVQRQMPNGLPLQAGIVRRNSGTAQSGPAASHRSSSRGPAVLAPCASPSFPEGTAASLSAPAAPQIQPAFIARHNVQQPVGASVAAVVTGGRVSSSSSRRLSSSYVPSHSPAPPIRVHAVNAADMVGKGSPGRPPVVGRLSGSYAPDSSVYDANARGMVCRGSPDRPPVAGRLSASYAPEAATVRPAHSPPPSSMGRHREMPAPVALAATATVSSTTTSSAAVAATSTSSGYPTSSPRLQPRPSPVKQQQSQAAPVPAAEPADSVGTESAKNVPQEEKQQPPQAAPVQQVGAAGAAGSQSQSQQATASGIRSLTPKPPNRQIKGSRLPKQSRGGLHSDKSESSLPPMGGVPPALPPSGSHRKSVAETASSPAADAEPRGTPPLQVDISFANVSAVDDEPSFVASPSLKWTALPVESKKDRAARRSREQAALESAPPQQQPPPTSEPHPLAEVSQTVEESAAGPAAVAAASPVPTVELADPPPPSAPAAEVVDRALVLTAAELPAAPEPQQTAEVPPAAAKPAASEPAMPPESAAGEPAVAPAVTSPAEAAASAPAPAPAPAPRQDVTAKICSTMDLEEVLNMEEDATTDLLTWMIWMVHRVELNDPSLERLSFANCPIPSPHEESRVLPKLIRSLARNTNLQGLCLNNCGLRGGQEVVDLAEALKTNSSLRALEVESNHFEQLDLQEIFAALAENIGLEAIRCGHQFGMRPGAQFFESVSACLDQNRVLSKLGMHITDAHWRNEIHRRLQRNMQEHKQRRLERKYLANEAKVQQPPSSRVEAVDPAPPPAAGSQSGASEQGSAESPATLTGRLAKTFWGSLGRRSAT